MEGTLNKEEMPDITRRVIYLSIPVPLVPPLIRISINRVDILLFNIIRLNYSLLSPRSILEKQQLLRRSLGVSGSGW